MTIKSANTQAAALASGIAWEVVVAPQSVQGQIVGDDTHDGIEIEGGWGSPQVSGNDPALVAWAFRPEALTQDVRDALAAIDCTPTMDAVWIGARDFGATAGGWKDAVGWINL